MVHASINICYNKFYNFLNIEPEKKGIVVPQTG
jgi:hypothetical protein